MMVKRALLLLLIATFNVVAWNNTSILCNTVYENAVKVQHDWNLASRILRIRSDTTTKAKDTHIGQGE